MTELERDNQQHSDLSARVEQLEAELGEARDRLQSLLALSNELVCCIEFDPPVPTNLPAREQAAMMLSGHLSLRRIRPSVTWG